MWAIGLELVIPAILLLILWRIWPKASDDTDDRANSSDDASNKNPHDHTPR